MLIKLYEATSSTDPEAIDAFSNITSGWYAARYDCAVHFSASFGGGFYKLYRDGTLIRICVAADRLYGFSVDHDLPFAWYPGQATYLHDAIGMKLDPSKAGPITYTGLTASSHNYPVVYGGYYYRVASATTFTKHNLATGALVETFTTTGTLAPFSADRLDITPQGVVVMMDLDNSTVGLVRFYDLTTRTTLYESAIERSRAVFVDRVHKNIWSVKLSDSRMQVYSFDVAPYAFTPFTVGSNRSRYRQDTISTILVGAQGEPVRFWPVGWRLTQPSMGGGFMGDLELGFGPLGSHGSPGPSAEGHLQYDDITTTDAAGVTTNLYCGPGSADYVGQSATIEGWTGY